MSPHPMRRALLALAVLCLLALCWTGVVGGLHQLSQSQTSGQTTQTIAQLGYGVLSFLGILTTFGARHWHSVIMACWAACLTAAAGIAAVVWGGASLITGMAAAGAAFLVAAAIIWMLRVGTRHSTSS